MPTKKRPRNRGRARSADNRPPLTPEEYLALDNETATREMPKRLTEEVETRRVEIYAPGKDFDLRKAIRQNKTSGVWEMKLPKGAGVGLPGRRYGRMSPAQVVRGIKG